MKTIKILIILTVITFLTTISNRTEAKDCSEYELLSHEWNKCKISLDIFKKDKKKKDKKKNEVTSESKALIKSKTVSKFNEKCKTLIDCIKAARKKE